MIRRSTPKDYETVSRSRPRRGMESAFPQFADAPVPRAGMAAKNTFDVSVTTPVMTALKRGHVLSFAALFLFTIVLYGRPAEFNPSVWTNSLALIVGIVTLLLFAATQVTREGNLSARPAEVNLVLLFMLTGLLSIPLAIDPAIAWSEFSGTFVRGILIFVVII